MTKPIFLVALKPKGIDSALETCYRLTTFNVSKYVNFLGELSHQLPVIFGVPQGSCLGPLNVHKNTEFVLFADDTNIFVKAKNKTLAYEKANTILKSVDLYMMTNKLHINMSKSCFIDF